VKRAGFCKSLVALPDCACTDDGPGGRITIVGVVGNVRIRGAEITPEPQLYTPYLQYFQPLLNIVVRSSLNRDQLISRVKTAIRSSDSEQAVFNVSTMEDLFFDSIASIATPRFNASVAGAFALLPSRRGSSIHHVSMAVSAFSFRV
jgi:hypothetical protein